MQRKVSKAEIKAFWESKPLFAGEVDLDPFSPEFIDAHENVYKQDVFAGRGFPDHYFPFDPGSSVLDIGCGPGIWTRELCRRGFKVTAIDLTSTAVEITRASLAHRVYQARVQVGDAEQLPFPDASFDGAVSHGAIHHTPNTERCVKEISRVLRPGGIAVVSVYYRNLVLRSPFLTRVTSLLLKRWVGLPGRGRGQMLESGDSEEIIRLYDGADNPLGKAFTRAELVRMFHAASMQVAHVDRYYFPRRAFGRLAPLLAPFHGTASSRLGLMITVCARKAGPKKVA